MEDLPQVCRIATRFSKFFGAEGTIITAGYDTWPGGSSIRKVDWLTDHSYKFITNAVMVAAAELCFNCGIQRIAREDTTLPKLKIYLLSRAF